MKKIFFANLRKSSYSITMAVLLLGVLINCSSCGAKADSNKEEGQETIAANDEEQEVAALPLKYGDFNKEIISNGKLMAVEKADLKFRSAENLASVLVKNGDRVSKGQTIAKLDHFSLTNTLKQSRNQFEQAKIELQDVLIGQGYNIKDTASIPVGTFKAAKVKSGYDKAMADLEMAEYNLKASVLQAPFSGVVANIASKENNQSNPSDKFCTVIDDSRFEAEFPILESELGAVKIGQTVRILPFSSDEKNEVKGQIVKINPVVEANGMVKVNAVCSNVNHQLFEGMNVKVVVENKVPHCLVIPKQALVLRSEKQVVFTLEGGRAKWKYVKTVLENISSFSITEGLKEGDVVIYKGNLNLAHDAKVKLIKND